MSMTAAERTPMRATEKVERGTPELSLSMRGRKRESKVWIETTKRLNKYNGVESKSAARSFYEYYINCGVHYVNESLLVKDKQG